MDTADNDRNKQTAQGACFCSEAFFADISQAACVGQQSQGLNRIDQINAATLMAQLEMIQRQLVDLDNDIGLLMTVENALDIISDNLARVKRLTMQKHELACSAAEKSLLTRQIFELLSINRIVMENCRFKNIPLFEDGSIRMTCSGKNELYLMTSALPAIENIDTDNAAMALGILEEAAEVINDWYREVNWLMYALQEIYQQLYGEVDLLREALRDLVSRS